MLDFLFSMSILVFMLFIYLIPTMVAYKRNSRQLTAIFMLNLLTGWSFIGWVVALVWAFYKDKEVIGGK